MFLGPEGTFTEQAALDIRERTQADVDLEPAVGVSEAIGAVREGSAAGAVVPVENSVEGSVALTQDELIHGHVGVHITAEALVPVTFELLVRPGTELADIRRVGSHPHGLAQVRQTLAASIPGVELVEAASTAAAAASVAAGELDAAAAAKVAGERYGLESAMSGIGLRHNAVTRFALVQPDDVRSRPTGRDRTSFVATVPHQPGTLLTLLRQIADRGINLTRLESRPTREVMGEYLFLVEAEGHADDPAMSELLNALRDNGYLLRFLGSYPRAE